MEMHGSGKDFTCITLLCLVLVAGCKESDELAVLPSADAALPDSSSPPSASATNSSPVISGRPASQVVVGGTFDFTPSASDSDGDRLLFSIENIPYWLQFDTSNGRLFGLVAPGTEGLYNDIRISATDGSATVTLQPFSIDVVQSALGAVTLSWTAPSANIDGTPLTDLRSYTVYYGIESGNYTQVVSLDNAGTTTYVIENLVPNTYYFAITASNSGGVESGYSNEAVRIVE